MQESVILVNERDEPQGNMEKMRAHREGHLHRAFSIFIFNREGNLLLQQRAAHKYHSAGLWSNTCCSHPRPGESIADAAARRLQEEMGLQTELVYLFRFQYHALLENGLTEHELDHVLIGFSDEAPVINADEVQDWKYVDLVELETDLFLNPLNYTVWFRKCFHRVMKMMQEAFSGMETKEEI